MKRVGGARRRRVGHLDRIGAGGPLEVALWAQRPEHALAIATTHFNDATFPASASRRSVLVTSDLAHAVEDAELVLAATPVAGLRDVLQKLDPPLPVVWLCKGFEEGSGLLPHQVAAETLGEKTRCGALSGPSFADEVARGMPCALTLASADAGLRARGRRASARRPQCASTTAPM